MRHLLAVAAVALFLPALRRAQEKSLIGELEGVDDPHRRRAGEVQRSAAARGAGRRRQAAAGRGACRIRAAGPQAGRRDRQIRRHLAPRLPRTERLGERAPARWLHDRLLFWDYTETEIVPNIAKGYEMSEDGKTTRPPSCARARSGRTASRSPPTTSSSGTTTSRANKEINPNGIPELMVARQAGHDREGGRLHRPVSSRRIPTTRCRSSWRRSRRSAASRASASTARAATRPSTTSSSSCPKYAGEEAVDEDGQGRRLRQLGDLLPREGQRLPQRRTARDDRVEAGAADHRRRLGIRAQPLLDLDGRGGQPAPLYRPRSC